MAQHNAAAHPTPLAKDPVFRRVAKHLPAELGATLKAIDAGKAAPSSVRPYLTGPNGPTMLRIGLFHQGWRARTALLREGLSLAFAHPRLTGFMLDDLGASEAERVIAAVRFALAAQCDVPAMYIADALKHANTDVRRAVLLGAAEQTDVLGAEGLWEDVEQHMRQRERDPTILALFARVVGKRGLVGASSSLKGLLKHRAALVRAEASVAYARLEGSLPARHLSWLRKHPGAEGAYLRAWAAIAPTLRSASERVAPLDSWRPRAKISRDALAPQSDVWHLAHETERLRRWLAPQSKPDAGGRR